MGISRLSSITQAAEHNKIYYTTVWHLSALTMNHHETSCHYQYALKQHAAILIYLHSQFTRNWTYLSPVNNCKCYNYKSRTWWKQNVSAPSWSKWYVGWVQWILLLWRQRTTSEPFKMDVAGQRSWVPNKKVATKSILWGDAKSWVEENLLCWRFSCIPDGWIVVETSG